MSLAKKLLDGGDDALSGSYVSKAQDSSNSSTYTFSSQNYDGPGYIVVAVHCQAVNDVPTSVTLGGVTMTELAAQQTNGDVCVGLYGLEVTSGSSADIVVNQNDAASRCQIGVWNVQNADATTPLYDGKSNAGLSSSASLTTLDTADFSFVIIAVSVHDTVTVTPDNASLTENYEDTFEGNHKYQAASEFVGDGEGAANVDYSATLGSSKRFAIAGCCIQ